MRGWLCEVVLFQEIRDRVKATRHFLNCYVQYPPPVDYSYRVHSTPVLHIMLLTVFQVPCTLQTPEDRLHEV